MAMPNKKSAICHFGSRCKNGDDCQYAHPEREGNISVHPQSNSRRPQSVARGIAAMQISSSNRRSRTNSRNRRPNSKVRHSNANESIDDSSHLPLSIEQIKKNIKDLYEVCKNSILKTKLCYLFLVYSQI